MNECAHAYVHWHANALANAYYVCVCITCLCVHQTISDLCMAEVNLCMVEARDVMFERFRHPEMVMMLHTISAEELLNVKIVHVIV